MLLKYKRNAEYVTTIEGIHFLPGTRTIDVSEAVVEKLKNNSFFKFEVKNGRLEILDEVNYKAAAKNGEISLKELSEAVAAIEAELEEMQNKKEELKAAKKSTKEVNAEIKKKEVELEDAKAAYEDREKEIEEAKNNSGDN